MGSKNKADQKQLVDELVGLFSSLQHFRRELAAIRHPSNEPARFDTMSEQLDAIVDATETATDTILGTVEDISQSIEERRSQLESAGLTDWAGEIETKFQSIFEACSFQDITGQRITKIVAELKFIDERLNSMIEIWGPEGLLDEPVPAPVDDTPEGEKLDGPALAGQGVSQDEIDKMFD